MTAGKLDVGDLCVGVVASFGQILAHSDNTQHTPAGRDDGTVFTLLGTGVQDSVGVGSGDHVAGAWG